MTTTAPLPDSVFEEAIRRDPQIARRHDDPRFDPDEARYCKAIGLAIPQVDCPVIDPGYEPSRPCQEFLVSCARHAPDLAVDPFGRSVESVMMRGTKYHTLDHGDFLVYVGQCPRCMTIYRACKEIV